jgi:hypothetical protein
MNFIRDEFLSNVGGSYKNKFEVLANENPKLLEKWKIDKDEYYTIYQSLMSKLNKHAHSFFDTSEAFTLTENDLEKKELQLIGFLWSVVPLNEKNLIVRKSNQEVVLLIDFIQK